MEDSKITNTEETEQAENLAEGIDWDKADTIPDMRPDNYLEETKAINEERVREIDALTGGKYSIFGLMYLAAFSLGHYSLTLIPKDPAMQKLFYFDGIRTPYDELTKNNIERRTLLHILIKNANNLTGADPFDTPPELTYINTPLGIYFQMGEDNQLKARKPFFEFELMFPDLQEQADAIPADKLRELVFSFITLALDNYTTHVTAQYTHIDAVRKIIREMLQSPEGQEIVQNWDNYIFDKQYSVETKKPQPPLLWVLNNVHKEWKDKNPSVSGYKPAKCCSFLLDKASNTIFFYPAKYISGEASTLNMASEKATKILEAILKLTTEEGITFPKLTGEHLFVMSAAEGLRQAGNKVVTRTQLWKVMQGLTEGEKQVLPSQDQLAKVDKILEDLRKIQLEFDNAEEARATNYPRFQYKGALLPTEQIRFEIKGKWTDWGIKFLGEAPLFTFARGRKQLEAFDFKLINVPDLRNTADINSLKAYFLRQIFLDKQPTNTTATGESTATKSTKTKKPLQKPYAYNTAFGACGITGKQKSRLKEPIKKMFEHWKNKGIIKDFFTELKPRKEGKPTLQEQKAIIVIFPEQG